MRGKIREKQKGKWKAYILSRGGSITIRKGDLEEIIEVPQFRGREDLDHVSREKNEKLTEANKEQEKNKSDYERREAKRKQVWVSM